MDLTNASIITEQRKAGQHLDCCRILSGDNVCIYFYSSPLITLKENSTMANSNITEKEMSGKIFISSYIIVVTRTLPSRRVKDQIGKKPMMVSTSWYSYNNMESSLSFTYELISFWMRGLISIFVRQVHSQSLLSDC